MVKSQYSTIFYKAYLRNFKNSTKHSQMVIAASKFVHLTTRAISSGQPSTTNQIKTSASPEGSTSSRDCFSRRLSLADSGRSFERKSWSYFCFYSLFYHQCRTHHATMLKVSHWSLKEQKVLCVWRFSPHKSNLRKE